MHTDNIEGGMLTWPQILMCNGGELAGGPTDSCGKCVGGPLDCGLCCGGGLYPTLDPPTFPWYETSLPFGPVDVPTPGQSLNSVQNHGIINDHDG